MSYFKRSLQSHLIKAIKAIISIVCVYEEEVLRNSRNVYCSAWEELMGGRLLCFMALGTTYPHSCPSLQKPCCNSSVCVCICECVRGTSGPTDIFLTDWNKHQRTGQKTKLGWKSMSACRQRIAVVSQDKCFCKEGHLFKAPKKNLKTETVNRISQREKVKKKS